MKKAKDVSYILRDKKAIPDVIIVQCIDDLVEGISSINRINDGYTNYEDIIRKMFGGGGLYEDKYKNTDILEALWNMGNIEELNSFKLIRILKKAEELGDEGIKLIRSLLMELDKKIEEPVSTNNLKNLIENFKNNF